MTKEIEQTTGMETEDPCPSSSDWVWWKRCKRWALCSAGMVTNAATVLQVVSTHAKLQSSSQREGKTTNVWNHQQLHLHIYILRIFSNILFIGATPISILFVFQLCTCICIYIYINSQCISIIFPKCCKYTAPFNFLSPEKGWVWHRINWTSPQNIALPVVHNLHLNLDPGIPDQKKAPDQLFRHLPGITVLTKPHGLGIIITIP